MDSGGRNGFSNVRSHGTQFIFIFYTSLNFQVVTFVFCMDGPRKYIHIYKYSILYFCFVYSLLLRTLFIIIFFSNARVLKLCATPDQHTPETHHLTCKECLVYAVSPRTHTYICCSFGRRPGDSDAVNALSVFSDGRALANLLINLFFWQRMASRINHKV